MRPEQQQQQQQQQAPKDAATADLLAQANRIGVRVWTRDKLIKILNVFDGGSTAYDDTPLPSLAPAAAAVTTTATAVCSPARKASSHNLRAGPPAASAAAGLQDLRSLLAAERMGPPGTSAPTPPANNTASASPSVAYPSATSMPAPGSVTHSHGYEYRFDAKTGQYLLSGTYAPLGTPGYAYLLVEDATQIHRPMYMELFQYPKEPDELPPWPVLYNDGEGRCPFSTPSTSRRHTTPSPNATRSLMVLLDQDYSSHRLRAAAPRGSLSSYLSLDPLDPNSTAGPLASMAIPGGMPGPASTRAPTPLAEDMTGMHAPPSGISTTGTTVADLSISQLSIPSPQAPRTGSTALPRRSSGLLDPRMAALNKRPVVPATSALRAAKQPEPTAVRAFMAQRAMGPQPPPMPRKRTRDKKPGYCENCRSKFDDLEEHISSRRHVRFAQNDENFAALDVLLDSLARTPIGMGTALSSRPTSFSLSVEG